MKSRSETATSEQVLQWFYDHPEGVSMITAHKLLPGHIIPAGMLQQLFDAGSLIVVPIEPSPGLVDPEIRSPWEFEYRLSYEKWVELASRNERE